VFELTEPEIGQQILHYRVISKIGQGGMGSVYLAEDTKLNRKVALKFLPAEMIADPERLKRFEREAQTVAALNHPNIVTIYSVEDVEGVPFIAMELVEGKSLTELIPSEGLKLEAIFDLAIPMADAVSAAHERGISHRDLKPGNIMVGSDGRVKVLDFGLAKLLQESAAPDATSLSTQTLTKTGHALGTVTYMAPEQLKGKSPDQRADIFSLGIVLYQMASGQRPFQGETSAEVISSILRDAPPPVTDLKIELPSHLGRIVKRCLEKNPNHRYQTAAELRSELEELKREVESGTVFEEDAKTRAIRIHRSSRRKMGLAAVLGGAAIIVGLVALMASFIGKATDDQGPLEDADPIKTIAVLPFSNVGDTSNQSFSVGLNEEIGSLLTSLPDLQVVSRATARQQFVPEATTREIGEALGADYLVLGSVRWSDMEEEIATARATLQVIRVEDDIQVWSDSYDRQLVDDLAVQTEIAQHSVRAVGASVLGLAADQLPPEPEVEAPVEVAEEIPLPASQPKRAAQQSVATKPSPPPPRPTESKVTKIEEAPVTSEVQAAPSVMLEIELNTFEPEGVLTIYADDLQILSEDFHFEGQRKGILGRKKTAGIFSARQSVPANTKTLRVYLLVGNETKLVTLEPSLADATTQRLTVNLTRKGELEASLQ
jgi:non-specific serine/threonine protein kinase